MSDLHQTVCRISAAEEEALVVGLDVHLVRGCVLAVGSTNASVANIKFRPTQCVGEKQDAMYICMYACLEWEHTVEPHSDLRDRYLHPELPLPLQQ